MNFSVGVISSGSACASAEAAARAIVASSELRERWAWSRASRPFGAIFKTLPRAGAGRTMLLEEDQKHLRALYYAGAYARSAQPSGGLDWSTQIPRDASRSGAARAQVLAWRYRFFEVAGLEC